MIESVSAEATLTLAGGSEQYFYLEVYGETSPLLDERYAEVTSPTTGGTQAENSDGSRVYQYWWTIGHSLDYGPPNPYRFDAMAPSHLVRRGGFWGNLQERNGAAARVYLYFPVDRGWRVKELTATLAYLSPMPQQRDWWKTMGGDWQHISPLLQSASAVGKAVPIPAVAAAAGVLGTVAKLQINSVPQTSAIPWTVEKVTHGKEATRQQGILWNLPLSAFALLGSRMTGSVALTFIPAHVQEGEAVCADAAPQIGALEAHAVVYGPDGAAHWTPGPKETNFARLYLQPRIAAAAGSAGTSHD